MPAKGKIVKKELSEKVNIENILADYSDENLSFKYINKYEVSKENAIKLIGKAGVPSNITIALNKVEVTGVEDVSGVKMRQIKNEEYKQENLNDGLLFVKENPFEMTAFFLREGKSLTISMTVNGNDVEKYRKEFLNLVETVIIK